MLRPNKKPDWYFILEVSCFKKVLHLGNIELSMEHQVVCVEVAMTVERDIALLAMIMCHPK